MTDWREELKDLENTVLSKEAKDAIEYLRGDSCAVPFFKGLNEAGVARFGVYYAIAKEKPLPKDPNKFDRKGNDWRYGTKNLVGLPSVEKLFHIISETGEESHPSRVFAMYANIGLVDLHKKIKSGQSLDKILK